MSERPKLSRPSEVATWLGAVAFATSLFIVAPVAQSETLPMVDPGEVGFDSERLERLDVALQRAIDDEQLPGAVVLVARNGQLAHSAALGTLDPGSNVAMPDDAIFRIYSMTKPLVSVAVMILVEEGRIQLTDPVSKHLPEFADATVSVMEMGNFGRVAYSEVPVVRPMTVQDLLRHTSGLTYGESTQNEVVDEGYIEAGAYQPGVIPFDSRGPTPDEQVAMLAAVPLVNQPGTVWEYGLSSDVLGRVVEAVSGQRLEEFLAERVFEPLGMDDTAFHVPEEDLDRLAEPFAVDPASGQANVVLDVAAPPGNASGGAGAVSTASDYLRFTQMLLNGGELDGVRILSPTTVRLMTSDHLGDQIGAVVSPGELLLQTPGYTFGLGFAVREGDGVAGVPGSEGEFMWAGYGGTYFWADPELDLAAVFMSQAPGPERASFRRLVKQLVHQAVVD